MSLIQIGGKDVNPDMVLTLKSMSTEMQNYLWKVALHPYGSHRRDAYPEAPVDPVYDITEIILLGDVNITVKVPIDEVRAALAGPS